MARSGIVRVTWNRARASFEVFSEPRTERNRRQWSVMNEQDDVVDDTLPAPPLLVVGLVAVDAVVEVVVEAAAGGCLDDRSEPLSLLLALVPLLSRATPSSSSSSS